MADARDVKVWTVHAEQQWEANKPLSGVSDSFVAQMLREQTEDVTKVLDLGCGSALWRHLFDDYDYTGADQNERMIHYAKKRFPEDKFVVTNGMSLDLEDESFDLVFTSAVLQHNRHPDKKLVVGEIVRVLRPGGYYLCTENTFRPDNCSVTFGALGWHENMDDGYSFTWMGWEKFMKPLGLRLVKFQEPSEYLFVKE